MHPMRKGHLAALYVVNMISRARIDVIGLNLCLDFKKYSLCTLCVSDNQALMNKNLFFDHALLLYCSQQLVNQS